MAPAKHGPALEAARVIKVSTGERAGTLARRDWLTCFPLSCLSLKLLSSSILVNRPEVGVRDWDVPRSEQAGGLGVSLGQIENGELLGAV